uniref:Protein Wnt n=1 Tax=Hydra vulgaris TaxID=6087 RepID=B9WZC2_HYDVU|nr:secreted signaling factor Wnt9/10c [Hydra vulgaris]
MNFCNLHTTLFFIFIMIKTTNVQGQSDSTYNDLPNALSSSLTSVIRLNTEYLRSNDDEATKKAISSASLCGINECQRQFKDEKWNCSIVSGSLLKTAKLATRESAFLFGIFSASLAHIISTVCLKGLKQECRYKLDPTAKDVSPTSSPLYNENCLQNCIKHGIDSSRELLSSKKIRDARWQMDEHNKEAGRTALEKIKKETCICHGLSGACALKKCVRILPSFEEMGNELKSIYNNAIKAGPDNNGQLITHTNIKPEKNYFIFMTDSPDFCNTDVALGAIGTKGRKCSLSANSPDSCEKLCCNRGFSEFSFLMEKTCACKFHYCCRLDCKTCQHNVTEFRRN